MTHTLKSKVYLVHGSDSVKAIADVCFDNSITVKDCRLVKRTDGELEIELPKVKQKDGTYRQTVQLTKFHTIVLGAIKHSVIEAYNNAQQGITTVSSDTFYELQKYESEQKKLGIKATIHRVDVPQNPSLKAIADISVDNYMIIKDIRVVEQNNQYRLIMPKKTMPDGSKTDRIVPANNTIAEKLKTSVVSLLNRKNIRECDISERADDMYMFP